MKTASVLGRIAVSFLLAAVARGGVIVVDASGSGSFATIQAAIDAAQPGDTLLVKGGAYAAFTVHGKALSIVADVGAPVTVSGTSTVENLRANQLVVLSGLLITGTTTTALGDAPGTGLVVASNSGALRAEDCRFEGARGFGDGTGDVSSCCDLPNHFAGWPGAIVRANPSGAAFVRCQFVGGGGANANIYCYCGRGGEGGDGLRISGGIVALHDCALTGGRGGDNGNSGGTGGAGARLLAASGAGFSASTSTFQGGNGGDAYDYLESEGGAGGDGAVLESGGLAWFIGSTQTGGVGGEACDGLFPPGPDGVGVSGSGASFTFSAPSVVLDMPRVAREQTVMTLTIVGRPGDEVCLYMGVMTPFRPIAAMKGVLLARNPAPQFVAILGPIPASGVLHSDFAVSDLGPSVASQTWFFQPFTRSATDGLTLGSFCPVTLLDSSY